LVKRKANQPQIAKQALAQMIADSKASFDEAQKLIPKPMMMQIDADVSDVSEFWLEIIALEAAKAGQPKQAMQRIAGETNLKRLLMFAATLQQGGNTNAGGYSVFAQPKLTEQSRSFVYIASPRR
jgi:hypothetical protein